MRRLERGSSRAERRPRLLTGALGRLARLLDIDRLVFGERTSWTARTTNGVYSVELEQSILGTSVRVDGRTVARSAPWSYARESYTFDLGGTAATVVLRSDVTTYEVRAALLVNGQPVPVDPQRRGRRSHGVPWRTALAAGVTTTGATLAFAAAIGDPLRDAVATSLKTAVNVVWLAGVRGIDPFAIVPAWISAATATRAGLLLLGLELIGAVAFVRDHALRSRLPLLGSSSRFERVAGWALLVLVAAALPAVLAD